MEWNQSEKEFEIDELDQLLQEADELITARPRTSQVRRSVSDSAMDVHYATTNNQQSIAPTIGDVDDLLWDLDTYTAPKQSTRPSVVSSLFSADIIFPGNRLGGGFFVQPKFCDKLKREIKENHSVRTTIVDDNDKSQLQELIYIIKLESDNQNNVDTAHTSLKSFLTTVSTALFDDQLGFLVKYEKCASIVQAYGDQNEYLNILCEHSTIGLIIYYFDEVKSSVFPNLCTTQTTLEKIIQKFLSIDISLSSASDLTTLNEKSRFSQDIRKIEQEMQSESILIIIEQRRIRLFGLAPIVKDVEKQIEQIKAQHASNTVKLILEPEQITYIFNVHYDQLKLLEAQYNETKIVDYLENGEFTAPNYLHKKIEEEIMALATLCSPIDYIIQEEAFLTIAHNECPNLINIGRQYKCHLEIHQNTTKVSCPIPKATTQDRVSSKLTAAAIKIHKDDLAEQGVDLVVICSTSMYLLNGILKKAGQSVIQEYIETAKTSSMEPFETNAGLLRCRKLLFLPWEVNQTDNEAFYQSIRNFVSKAVQHAVRAHHTSIAFPSIGCGKLNIDKNIIANEMLVEAQNQLLRANVLLQIIFVILPGQIDVFQAFEAKLESLQKGKAETSDTVIPYYSTILGMTIISSNVEMQGECKKALNVHVQRSILVLELFQQDVLKKWTQPAINAFYKYCLDRHVIPNMDIVIGYFKLVGPKDAVRESENEYYREQTKQSEQARLIAIARNIIWAYKSNSSNFEKYSPELNARIEDAFKSRIRSFNFTDDKSVTYVIDFETMIETCLTDEQQRHVTRHADFDLPQYWEVQSENVAQFPVAINSVEFNDIRALFDKTMTKKYHEIIRIDRIQNKPWFMQYNSYKSFSLQQDTERQLFHGCPQQSALLIMNSFFNRSFAGVNGVVYGQGAYFSTKASYSHGYAPPNPLNGERCMFVVNVIVGRSISGNSTMKTPPLGFESTTDGDHIFVTYRDDQAYAAYLIVYQ